jgi:hypothetical protein
MFLHFSGRQWLPVLVFAALASTELGASQAQGFPWWKSEAFKQELGLTADQAARIEKIYQDTVPELRQEWAELDRLEVKLSRLFEGNADEAVLARQIDRVETARANLNKSRSLMLMRMRRVLNADQLVRFKVLYERWDAESRKQGPRPSAPSQGRR